MPTPEETEVLRHQWLRLLERFRVAAADSAPVFEVLAAAYSARDRYYHNLDHIAEIFAVTARLSSITDDPSQLHLAIWFHDAVYDPRSKDNEARSADLAVTLLGPIGVPRSTLDRVAQLVHATAHLSNDLPPADRETSILLDADLAVLGADEARYRQYAADVRREYAWVRDAEYNAGRAAVLEAFLRRPRIYRTEVLHRELDEPARANLRWELARLMSGG